jgi:crossover junction endodeoxyribonuclease RuvC
MGYGIIKATGNNPQILTMGVIELIKYKDHYVKLKKIFDRTLQLINEFCPDELAIEAPFYGKNVQSMLKLGRAQGAAIAAALNRSIPVFEYAPRKIKMSITGMGNASKEQVAGILQSVLDIQKIPKNLDATDGLAAALCHFYQKDFGINENNYNSWQAFINQNPGRIK